MAEYFFCFEALPAFTKTAFCSNHRARAKLASAQTKEHALLRRNPVFESCGASANEENSCQSISILSA